MHPKNIKLKRICPEQYNFNKCNSTYVNTTFHFKLLQCSAVQRLQQMFSHFGLSNTVTITPVSGSHMKRQRVFTFFVSMGQYVYKK